MNKHKWNIELMNGDSLCLIADEVAIYPDGSLVFSSAIDEKQIPNFAIAPGQWRLFYVVSLTTENAIIPRLRPVKQKKDDAETRILKHLADKGPRTIREIAQGVRGLVTLQIRPIIERLVNEKTLQESKVGRAIRYSLTEA
jgi:hypothetical protein